MVDTAPDGAGDRTVPAVTIQHLCVRHGVMGDPTLELKE
jgi:hypothetical protein